MVNVKCIPRWNLGNFSRTITPFGHRFLFGGTIMPRYYFHLSAPDESFRDLIGFEVSDLSAAHSRALQLADRVRMIGGLALYAPDLGRWSVQIADEFQRPVMTVLFSAEVEKRKAVDNVDGARALQDCLATRWQHKTFLSQSRLKPIHQVSRSLGRQGRPSCQPSSNLSSISRQPGRAVSRTSRQHV